MIAEEVALRYSKALMALGGSPEQLSSRLATLEAVDDHFRNHPGLRKMLLAPHLTYEEQQPVLQKLSEQCQVDAEVLNFLSLLLQKRRLNYLSEIVRAFKRRVKGALGLADAHLVTAVPLNDATRAKLHSRLEMFFAKKMTFIEAIDPRIIGGAILVVDRRMADLSVRARLAKFRDQLLAIRLT